MKHFDCNEDILLYIFFFAFFHYIYFFRSKSFFPNFCIILMNISHWYFNNFILHCKRTDILHYNSGTNNRYECRNVRLILYVYNILISIIIIYWAMTWTFIYLFIDNIMAFTKCVRLRSYTTIIFYRYEFWYMAY